MIGIWLFLRGYRRVHTETFNVASAKGTDTIIQFMSEEGKTIIRKHGGLESVQVYGEWWPPYMIHATVWAKKGSWLDHGTILHVPDPIK